MHWLTNVFKRFNSAGLRIAGKFFTPKEYYAALFFLGLGIIALGFRAGKKIIAMEYPSLQSSEQQAAIKYNDSIFAVLSQKASERDSLEQSLSEDSIIVLNNKKNYTEKEKMLSPNSIVLNTADSMTLSKLPGIGFATARKIISYRNSRGKFRALKEVMNVDGIGEGKYKKMQPYLRLN